MSEEMKNDYEMEPVDKMKDIDPPESVMETNDVVESIMNSKRSISKDALERSVKLKMLMIGVGNAGNQTVTIAARENLNVFAINTSVRDLNDIIVDDQIPCWIAGRSGMGSGKNIKKGIELFKENGRELFTSKTFIDKCQEADIIFVTSSISGGSGSAIAPEICRLIKSMFDKKILIYHGICPKNTDANIAFSNATYCLNEIKKLDIPYMLTDLETFSNEPNDVAFMKADKHVVECAKVISGHYLKMSNSQMMDENDLRSVIGEPGYMGVYSVNNITSHDLESKTMQSMLIQKIKEGPSVIMQKDGICMQMASMINCPEDMSDPTKTGNYTELFEFVGHRPKNGVYENYATTDGTNGQLIVILSGMTYPINRLEVYINMIKEQNEFLKKQKQIDISGDVEIVQKLVSNPNSKLSSETTADEEDIKSVIDGYF